MRHFRITALAVAVILLAAVPGNRATAMTPAAPAALGITTAALLERVVVVCGTTGCRPVQTSRVIHHQHRP